MVDRPLDPAGSDLSAVLGTLQSQQSSLTTSANGFASAMTRAFTQATAGGKQFDSVLQSLALRISSLAVAQAFKPIATGITNALTGGLTQLFGGLGGSGGLPPPLPGRGGKTLPGRGGEGAAALF